MNPLYTNHLHYFTENQQQRDKIFRSVKKKDTEEDKIFNKRVALL